MSMFPEGAVFLNIVHPRFLEFRIVELMDQEGQCI